MAFEELEETVLLSDNGMNQLIHCYDPEDKRILIVLLEDISGPTDTRTPAEVKIFSESEYDPSAIDGPLQNTLTIFNGGGYRFG
jgi:hypothetical protein